MSEKKPTSMSISIAGQKKKAVKIKNAEGVLGCGRDDIKGRWNKGLVLAPRAADHLAVDH